MAAEARHDPQWLARYLAGSLASSPRKRHSKRVLAIDREGRVLPVLSAYTVLSDNLKVPCARVFLMTENGLSKPLEE